MTCPGKFVILCFIKNVSILVSSVIYKVQILKYEASLSLVVACYFIITAGELSGEEYKKQLINSLCSSR